MDALAQTLNAIPFLAENTISDTINIYRASEIPLEPHLLALYFAAETGSTAILTAVDAL